MKYLKKSLKLLDNYVISRLQNRPSTALFWYLPEPARVRNLKEFQNYLNPQAKAPFYLIDYQAKLKYSLVNAEGIIVLPYEEPIGKQINPEAAFQYALGLHDTFCQNAHPLAQKHFFHYANYFVRTQSQNGFWEYCFDWFQAKSPWGSALAQARGASVMLRAWLHTSEIKYLNALQLALANFFVPIEKGGFAHLFAKENCIYYEEYPYIPTGVINGFMAALISLWECQHWLRDRAIQKLWEQGLASLEKMLPYYSNGWWSIYDRDEQSPITNVNSPRYHLMEINYLNVLSVLSQSNILELEWMRRSQQYQSKLSRLRALFLKSIRKIMYK